MKPTPGPYKIKRTAIGWHVLAGAKRIILAEEIINAKGDYTDATDAQARANAEAWIAGAAAMEKLRKIQAAYNDKTLPDELLVIGIGQILDEP